MRRRDAASPVLCRQHIAENHVATSRRVHFTSSADYQWSLRGLAGEELAVATRACHQRSADRMVKLAGVNGGVYVKAGQHLGQMV